MGWIDVEDSLPTHRKTLEAADDLDIEPVQLVGHLTCFWLWATNNADNAGLLPKDIRARTIARAALWSGDADRFVAAIGGGRFLEERADGRLAIHDWDKHYGKWADRREKDAERKRDERKNGQSEDVRPMSSGRPALARALKTGPNLTGSTDMECHVDPDARARARDPDEPTARVAPTKVPQEGEPVIERDGRRFLPGTGWVDADSPPEPQPLRPGAQHCPLCSEVFDGTYGDHLESSPKHKSQPPSRPGNLGRHFGRGSDLSADELRQAADALAAHPRPTPEEIAAHAASLNGAVVSSSNGHAPKPSRRRKRSTPGPSP
ncbi:MAG TPA: hypothetical protein VFB50_05615 [Chloroflexota bacterium]|nr:hypothetical protein [Chloroflexota bacterium]